MVQTTMYNITPDELTAIIEAAVSRALGQSRPTPDRNAEIIDREELCRRLNITEPTVIRLEKKGKIPRMEIGTAIRYDWNKVVAALQADKGGKRFV